MKGDRQRDTGGRSKMEEDSERGHTRDRPRETDGGREGDGERDRESDREGGETQTKGVEALKDKSRGVILSGAPMASIQDI